MTIQTINPATETALNTYPLYSQTQLETQINASHARFLAWKTLSFHERGALMLALAQQLRAKARDYAQLMAQEMGKPITSGLAEIEKCAWACEYYATHAEDYLVPKSIDLGTHQAKVCYLAQGIIFAVMPWNFPFWQIFRFAVPTIMSGNVALFKHAPNCTGTGYAIREAFLAAGFPEHVLTNLVLSNEQTADVIAHPLIRGVSFTGSERTGKILGACAGSHLKKIVMELGGNDPYVVLADADLDLAAQVIVAARLNNNGQVCLAAKRAIVVQSVAAALTEKMLTLMRQYTFGDPLNPQTQLGPMARADLRAQLHQQVLESVTQGAQLVLGGSIPEQCGYYYPPTVLTEVQPGMPAFDDELFGPVLAICVADNEAQALMLANHSRFGLGSAIFTRNTRHGEELATHTFDNGTCAVNSAVSSDPRVPIGGVKHSGYGRELSSAGIHEFMNIKTVLMAPHAAIVTQTK
jgi:succinate-semialdehyde dehydrogenase/glutarate-semialdehyde dehydrogenase